MGCCSGDVLIRGGQGVVVEGSGSSSNPYIIQSDLPDFAEILTVLDTSSLNLSLRGSGVAGDPFVVSGRATVRVVDLIDVEDPEGGPAPGETLVWVGTGAEGHFEFRTPATASAGTVSVSNGIGGAGTPALPLRVRTSGVWGVAPLDQYGSDPSVGGLIYVDADGLLRAEPVVGDGGGGASVTWSTLTGKPATFAPSAHTHAATDISATEQRKLDVGKVNGTRWTSSIAAPTTATAGDVWIKRP